VKILITSSIFPPEIGGPATFVYDLCNELKSKHEFKIITFGNEVKKSEDIKIINIKLNYPFLGTLFRQGKLLYEILKNGRNVDFIFAQCVYVTGLMSLIGAKLLRKKLILKYVGDPAWEFAFGNNETDLFLDDFLKLSKKSWKSKIQIRVQKSVLKNVDKIIVPSEYLKKVIINNYKVREEKIRVIYNAIKDVQITQKKEKNEVIQITTIGRLVKWKNISGILKAVSLIKDKKINLMIIGSGPEEENLREEALNLGILEKVNFAGNLPHNETLKRICGSDIFILNSFYEGLPHTIIEAMMLKTPVIATNISGTNEIAINNKTALLIEKNDEKDLVAKINKIIEDKELREKLVENGEKSVKKMFGFERLLNEYNEEFKKAGF